jgi:ribosome-associated protein
MGHLKMNLMLNISKTVSIPLSEIEIHAVRSQGPGGQNVNKVATAIHLRFDIRSSSLPDVYKKRLLALSDYRITKAGIIIIKAQRYRNQEKNREDATGRLKALIAKAGYTPKKRKTTKPSKTSQVKRIESKIRRGRLKTARKKVAYE